MMQQFSSKEIADLKSRIDEIHELLASRGDDGVVAEFHGETLNKLQSVSTQPTVNHLMFDIHVRRYRKAHFDGVDLHGASWDMLLDLMMAERNGRELSASDLATGAHVPLSSGLRMIASLEAADLVRRFTDHRDRRRSLVHLTEKGRERMSSYFHHLDGIWRNCSQHIS